MHAKELFKSTFALFQHKDIQTNISYSIGLFFVSSFTTEITLNLTGEKFYAKMGLCTLRLCL